MPDIFTDPTVRHHITPETKSTDFVKHKGPQNPQLNNVNIFSTFVRDPRGIVIAEQHSDEHILLFIRRDFSTNTKWIAFGLLAAIIPFFLPVIFSPLKIIIDYFSPTTLVLLGFFYYLVIAGYIFGNFLTWFYDVGIVTEERAIDIDFYNISYVSVATARSQDLKDVRYFQRGIFESLFDYGDVTLVVEASGETLTFERTPRPAEVVSILSALIGGHQR